MDDENKEYCFEFYVDRAPKNKLRELQMTLTPLQYWGTSSYPLLILRTLENSQEPLDQQRIISHIEATNDTTIERKAIGRNITLLKDLGYDIQHNGDGYFIPKKAPSLEQDDFQAIVESVNANEALDDDRKHKLIDKLFEL
jgi:biotin operon repressor